MLKPEAARVASGVGREAGLGQYEWRGDHCTHKPGTSLHTMLCALLMSYLEASWK